MGGRSAKYAQPGSGNWSNGPYEAVPDTLKEAMGSKGKPLSIGESVVGTNPRHSYDYREYSQNCQRCVVAYELRRRGYDVTAQPTFPGDDLSRIAYTDTKNNIYAAKWRGAFKNAKTENVGVRGNNSRAEKEVIQNIENKMHGYGNGSRAVIQILYRGGGGHVFNVENQNGRVTYVEAQTGQIKDIAKTMTSVKTDSVNIVRVDNLRVSERAKKFVRQKP